MTRAQLPNEDDADKTKQQLIDNLQNEITWLRGEKELLGNIINIAADAIISIDEQQCITHFNKGAENIFGYSAQEIVGEPLEMLLPEKFRQKHGKHVQEFRKEQAPSRMMNRRSEIMGLKKNGTTFPARASISRIRQSGTTNLSVYLQDITDIKHAEQVTQKTRDELARVTRVGMMGEISASLAHELNQPLTAILTNAQVLKRRLDDASVTLGDSDEIISDVIHDTQRAGQVIERMRALLKPGKHQVEAVDLNQVVTDVNYLLSSEYVIRHTSVSMELTPDLPPVFADRIQLQQVLLNLITNAFDAMEGTNPAQRHLLIRTSLPESTLVEVCVRDSGAGFKETSYQQLLESFYTTKKSGMGMGLAISNTMLRTFGGLLWAENNQGPGATFYFTLPVTIEDDVVVADRQWRSQKEGKPDAARVFIVDDDPSIIKSMERLIGSAGYVVETFASAQAFLEREIYDGISCLVADLHMPGETGLDLQTALNGRDYSLPIIFITGAGDTPSSVHAMKHGAIDFLPKPVGEDVLLSTIARAIETDRQARNLYTQQAAAKETWVNLTPREREIMLLVVEGKLNKQIAHTLNISEKTVKAHRGNLMRKVAIRSVPELVRFSELVDDIS